MAGKSSKKSNDNFEKMKTEMSRKKQNASMKQASQASTKSIECNNVQLPLNIDCQIPSKNHCMELLLNKTENVKEDCEINKEPKDTIAEKLSKDEKDNSIKIKEVELIVFSIGEEEFAIKLSNIKEIIRVPSMTKLSNVPLFVVGLCSYRGGLLAVIDSRKLFGVMDKEYNESSRIIIIDIHGKQVGIIVDKVSQVLRIEESAIKEPPASIKRLDGGVIDGILVLDKGKRVVMLLDGEKTIKVAEYDGNTKEEQALSTNEISFLSTKVEEEEQIIIFTVGYSEYAVNISHVKEIIRLPDIMKIPNTAEFIEGVLSIRGQLLAVINLGKLMSINCKKPDEYSRIVIIDNGSYSFGVIVDRVSEVISFQQNLFKKQSEFTSGSSAEYLKGIVNLNSGKRLIILLEPNKLIKVEAVNTSLEIGENKLVNDRYLNMDNVNNSDFEHIVIFKIDKEEYGISINNVQGINRITEMIYFPGAPAFIDGMINLRGDAIPILNLKKMFNYDFCTY